MSAGGGGGRAMHARGGRTHVARGGGFRRARGGGVYGLGGGGFGYSGGDFGDDTEYDSPWGYGSYGSCEWVGPLRICQ